MSVRVEFSNLTQSQAHAVAEIAEAAEKLHPAALGIDAIDETDNLWSVSVYFDQTPAASDINILADLAAEALGIAPLTWSLEDVPDVDWVKTSLAALKPVEAGRFFVHGAHDRHLRPVNSIAIELEAGMAFGTGHHGTTKGCLLAFDRLLKQRRFGRILDIGTGTGILGIAAALALNTRIIASDIDPVAVHHATMNARRNGAVANVRALMSTGLNHRKIRYNGPYDLIFANILARPLAAMAGAIATNAAPGASVILSGILPRQSNFVESAYRAQGFIVVKRYDLENWITLCLRR